MTESMLMIGAISAAIAVLIGGARAHLLNGKLDPQRLALLDVGSRYQLIHALAIVLIALIAAAGKPANGTLLAAAGWGFVLGTLLFPCVLYAYAFTGQKLWLRVSMLGGGIFVAAWTTLALAAVVT